MGWFNEQLNLRKEQDEQFFAQSLSSIADAVMGRKLIEAWQKEDIAQSAVDEILKYYHCKVLDKNAVANAKTVDDKIEVQIRPNGIMRRIVTLEKGWNKDATGAMIGTLKEDGRAVALIPGKLTGYTFLNPATGKRERVTGRKEQLFDEEAICFYKPLPLKELTIKDLIQFSVESLSTSDVALLIGSTAIVSGVGLIGPVLTKWLFGTVLESRSIKVLMALAFFMLCFIVSKLLFTMVKTILQAGIGAKQNVAVQAAVMGRILSLPATFFKKYSSGELTQRALYVNSLFSTIFNSLGTVGLTSLFSLIYLGQIAKFAPVLAVPSLVIILSSVLISTISTLIQIKIKKKCMETSSKTSGLSYSTITGIQKIKLAGAEKRMFARWANSYAKQAELLYNPPVFAKLSGTFSLAVSLIGTLVLYILSIKSGISVENYYAFTSSYALVAGALSSLVALTSTFAEIRPCLEMAKPLLEAVPEVSENKHVLTDLKGNIELSNVSFRYNDDMPNVIDGLSLKIRAGEYVAIVGKTGCGKSTLLRLLLGFEKPQKGAIYYDNKDINTVDLKSLRRNIGTVMQNSKLFLGDIFSNIVISAPMLTLDDAWAAAEIASIADDIKAMPMGMHTYISEGHGGISGGQKQRLMIARAVAAKPKVLFFDEATSALDNVTQKKVSQAIDKLKCTRLVIAHRLSTIQNADRIIYLEDGKIKEEGTYKELIELNGLFASLVERQRVDYED